MGYPHFILGYCSVHLTKLVVSRAPLRQFGVLSHPDYFQALPKLLDLSNSGYSKVSASCQYNSHSWIRKYSVWDRKIKDVQTPLHASVVDDLAKFKQFIESSPAEITKTEDKFRATVMHLSVLNGSKDVFDYILSEKKLCEPLIDVPDINGMTPLHVACTMSNRHYYYTLMEKGANPLIKDKDGNNALHVAASYGALDIVKDLVSKYHVPLEITGENGGTALHFAARQGKLAIVEFLVKSGAKVDALSADGSTPLHLAAYGVKKNVSIFLIDRGANVNATNVNGSTPLHAAAAGDTAGVYEAAIIDYMLKNGALIDAVDSKGQTPRDIVETKTLKLLLSDKEKDWQSKKWHSVKEKFTKWWSRDADLFK